MEHVGPDRTQAEIARARLRFRIKVGIYCVVFVLFGFFVAGVLPILTSATMEGNADAAAARLKEISTSQALFRARIGQSRIGQSDFGSLAELSDAGLIDEVLGSGTARGYVFVCQPSSTTPEQIWTATANPSTPERTGTRWWAINHTGVLYCSEYEPIEFDDQGEVVTESARGIGVPRRR